MEAIFQLWFLLSKYFQFGLSWQEVKRTVVIEIFIRGLKPKHALYVSKVQCHVPGNMNGASKVTFIFTRIHNVSFTRKCYLNSSIQDNRKHISAIMLHHALSTAFWIYYWFKHNQSQNLALRITPQWWPPQWSGKAERVGQARFALHSFELGTMTILMIYEFTEGRNPNSWPNTRTRWCSQAKSLTL